MARLEYVLKETRYNYIMNVCSKDGVTLCLIFILLACGCLNIYTVYAYPLIAAVRAGRRDAVAVALLDKGAKIDEKDIHGLTALMYAAKTGHRQMVAMLLNRGAHANEKDNAGQTAADASQQKKWQRTYHRKRKSCLNIVWMLLNRGRSGR